MVPERTLPWNGYIGVFAALACCILISNSSALLGGYVYDDQILPDHPLLDGWDDTALAFVRTSGDYLSSVGGGAKGVTYRPLPLASLALTQAIAGSLPWLHHLVSIVFHLAALWFLTLVAKRHESDLLSPGAVLALTVFALHPVGVEAYGWINGRSDAMAGAVLCALAWVLSGDKFRTRWLFALVCLGCLCKETFIIASCALLVASQMMARGEPRPHHVRVWLGWGAAVCVFIFLRAHAGSSGSGGLGAASLNAAILSSARLLLLACKALLLPWPAPMLLLASALDRSVSTLELAAAAIAIAFLAHALLRRDWPRLILCFGAIATLLPAGLISNGFWLGFDRYLYMPLCLLFLGLSPWTSSMSARPLAWLTVILALLLGGASYLEGTYYESPEVFASSMAQARPDDPTGTLFLIQQAAAVQDAKTVHALAATIPVRNLPATLLQRVISVKLAFGSKDEARALAQEAKRRFPHDPRFRRVLVP